MNAYVKKALHSLSFMILLCLSIILILIPIFAPQLAPHDPLETNYAASMVEHSAEYPMGTDQIGRCILSRLIWGGRTSLLIVYWVVAIVAAIVLFGLPACGVELPMVLQYILYALIGLSVLGIFFYNNPASYRRPALGLLSNIGGGVWSTYSMATGLLGDLLSYIRLFALGLTGGVLGGVFNTLALDMTSSMPWYIRWLPLIIILLFGHGITFALSMISAFVHPMRLTFVEFFKNADYSGGGEEYDPFKK